MCDLPGGAVGGVVAQHVEDETFLDSLAHGIQMKSLRLVAGTGRQRGVDWATE
ncbi:hypothetical protein D3C84_426540 [compost metagenome]